ncbi:hypothetical protein HMN09_00272200 [Mycena chlorophos]|uniref:Uncharacterized protein n=1 Tax=Mycena chlorophos TaxID=658473 RepID=A0A8H6TMF3_MYCCL|nr:hypothetical protein HMN09_00272200 [Mycena chlorophos]
MATRHSRILSPTQPGTHRRTVSDTKLFLESLSSSNSCAIPDSTTVANLTRTTNDSEDVTLLYAPQRPSENDLTACVSTASGLGFQFANTKHTQSDITIPLLTQLPEIPDWYEDVDPINYPPEAHILDSRCDTTQQTPAQPPYETPQSEYFTVEEFQPEPDALYCEDVLRELEETAEQAHAQNVSQSSKISSVVAFGFPSPGFVPTVAGKHKIETPELLTFSPRLRRAIQQQRRRSYSLDSADRRPTTAELALLSEAGLGIGLASPFCLSQLQPIHPSESDMQLHALHAHPDCLASPEIVYTRPRPPGNDSVRERRQEALALERLPAPAHPHPHSKPAAYAAADEHDDQEEDDWDVRSASVPFPSTASLYAIPTSASWPAARHSSTCGGHGGGAGAGSGGARSRLRHSRSAQHHNKNQKQRTVRKWTLEEQITIAVLAAMDARDGAETKVAVAGVGVGVGKVLIGGEPRKLKATGNGKGRLLRLLRKVWRRDSDESGNELDVSV